MAFAYRGEVSGRQANLALGVLLPAASLTGFLLFLFEGNMAWPAALAHAAVGLAPLLLIPWKHAVVRRGLQHSRSGRSLSLILMWLALATLGSGVAHVVGVTASGLPVTVMQLHVGAGLAATVLTVVHAVQRPVRLRRTDWARRTVLRSGAIVAAAGALGAAGQSAAAAATSGRRRGTGSVRLASDDAADIPVTSWLFDSVPDVDATAWRVVVSTPQGDRQWSVPELAAGGDVVTAVLDCTGGWWTEQQWAGMRLVRLLPSASVGNTVLVSSATGYARRVPLTDDLLLATAVAGQPLSAGHGAPVRLVAPGRRGYEWVKWVVHIELVDGPSWAQAPLPLH